MGSGALKEEDAAGEDTNVYVQGLFGVLYTVGKEKGDESLWLVCFRIYMDLVQIYLLIVNPAYGWNVGDPNGVAWKVFSAIGLNWVATAMGWALFLALFYIMVVSLVVVIGLSVWIAICFSNNNFTHVWPIKFLRWYSNIFFKVLEVASMSLYLIILDCQYFPPESDPSQQWHNQEFPDVVCFEGTHMVHASMAVLSLVVFVLSDAAMQMAEIELDPLSRNLMSVGHTKTEVHVFLIKVLMTCAVNFLNRTKYLAVVLWICSSLLVYIQLTWLPQMHALINHLRAASAMVIWITSVLFLAMAFYSTTDEEALKDARDKISIAAWIATVPAAMLGAALSWARHHYYFHVVLKRIHALEPGSKPSRRVFKVTDARQIEILARCCRVWVDDDMPDQEAVSLAEAVIKYGLASMSHNNDAYLIILYSSFLIDVRAENMPTSEVQSSYQSGYAQLQAAKKADPSFLELFAIFAREQQHTQKELGDGGLGRQGPDINLVSFVEYRKNHRLVVNAHREALQAIRQFWGYLLQSDVSLSTLTRAVKQIDKTVTAADKVYRMVMVRHSTSVPILRLYARFLEDVKYDPWTATKWYKEADKYELAQEDAKNINMFAELGIDPTMAEVQGLGDLRRLFDCNHTPDAHNLRAVIVINAQCTVQMASSAVCKMFGFSSVNEIKGRNVNIIIPEPFGEHHNQYIRNYVVSGRASVLGHTRSIIAMTKNKAVFPISLTVSKMSGIGEDMLFMGVIEALPIPPDSTTLWVMMDSETIVAADTEFTNQLGFKSDEMYGCGLEKVFVDPKDIIRAFRLIRGLVTIQDQQWTSNKRETRRNSSRIRSVASETNSATTPGSVTEEHKGQSIQTRVQMKHRYLGPIQTTVMVGSAGFGAHRFFSLEIMRHAESCKANPVCVVSESGQLLHISRDLASRLAVDPQVATDDPQGFRALLPQPFAAMHSEGLASVGQFQALSRPIAPVWSCRSGLSILLSAANATGLRVHQPFKMQLDHQTDEGGDTIFIARMQETSLREALAERRVRLAVDADGTVQDVLCGNQSTFGFDCQALKGCVLGDFVDAFEDHYSQRTTPTRLGVLAQAEQALGAQPHVREPSSQLRRALVILAERAQAQPFCSWRVGVLSARMKDDELSIQSQMTRLGLRSNTGPVPAIMAVRVVDEELRDSGPSALHKLFSETTLSHRQSAQTQEQQAGTSASGAPPVATSLNFDENTRINALLKQAPGGWVFVMDLWRASTCSSVIELDGNCMVSHATNMPMYPPGLVFGTNHNDLIGQYAGTLLNLPPGLQAQALFNGALNPAVPDDPPPTARTRGSMRVTSRRNLRAMSVSSTMTIKHRMDDGDMDVMVQAVRKTGNGLRANGVYLVVRLVSPICARIDFTEHLIRQQDNAQVKQVFSTQKSFSASLKRASMATENTSLRRVPSRSPSRATLMLTSPAVLEGATPSPPPGPPPTGILTASLMRSRSNGSSAIPMEPTMTSPQAAMRSRSNAEPTMTSAKAANVTGMGNAADTLTIRASVEFQIDADDDLAKQGSDKIMRAESSLRVEQWVMNTGDRASLLEDVDSVGVKQRLSTDPYDAAGPVAKDDLLSPLKARAATAFAVPTSEADSDTNSDHYVANNEEGGASGRKATVTDPNVEQPGDESASAIGDDAASEMGDGTQADYKRGKQFKKILRLLGNNKAKSQMSRFRWQAYGVVISIIIVHLSLFILQHELLTQQKEGIRNLQSIGLACRLVGETTNDLQELYAILTNRGLPGLPGLATINDKPGILTKMALHVNTLEEEQEHVYMGLRSQKDSDSLLNLWNNKVLIQTVYTDDYQALTHYNTTTSLWDAGQRFMALSREIRQNHQQWYQKHGYFWEWSAVQNVISSGLDVIMPGYYQTMEGFLEIGIRNARGINRIQLAILILEGVVMPLASGILLWVLAIQVTAVRFHMYLVFILVPTALIRQLASKPIVLGDEEDENGDDVAELHDKNQAASVPAPKPMVKYQSTKITSVLRFKEDGWYNTLVMRLRQSLAPPGARGGNKRRLTADYRFAVWLAWPNLFWAVLNLVINIVAYESVLSLDARVAQLSIVNFVTARFQRTFFYAMELCLTNDQIEKDHIRSLLSARIITYNQEYLAMMQGGQAVNSTDARFIYTRHGVTEDDAQGADILFRTHDCLREDLSTCLPPSSPYYPWAHDGLDTLLVQYYSMLDAMTHIPFGSTKPTFNSSQMEFLWNIRPDLEGGLSQLSDSFYQSTLNVYDLASDLHIINLVITIVFGFLQYWFMLRPVVKEAKTETHRLAELLSQLPPEVAVDQLVRKAVVWVDPARQVAEPDDDISVSNKAPKDNWSASEQSSN